MAYRKPHLDCSESNCQSYSAYIRVQKKWIKAGEFNSSCKTFTPSKDVRTYTEIKQEELREWVEARRPYLERLIGKHSKL